MLMSLNVLRLTEADVLIMSSTDLTAKPPTSNCTVSFYSILDILYMTRSSVTVSLDGNVLSLNSFWTQQGDSSSTKQSKLFKHINRKTSVQS